MRSQDSTASAQLGAAVYLIIPCRLLAAFRTEPTHLGTEGARDHEMKILAPYNRPPSCTSAHSPLVSEYGLGLRDAPEF